MRRTLISRRPRGCPAPRRRHALRWCDPSRVRHPVAAVAVAQPLITRGQRRMVVFFWVQCLAAEMGFAASWAVTRHTPSRVLVGEFVLLVVGHAAITVWLARHRRMFRLDFAQEKVW